MLDVYSNTLGFEIEIVGDELRDTNSLLVVNHVAGIDWMSICRLGAFNLAYEGLS